MRIMAKRLDESRRDPSINHSVLTEHLEFLVISEKRDKAEIPYHLTRQVPFAGYMMVPAQRVCADSLLAISCIWPIRKLPI